MCVLMYICVGLSKCVCSFVSVLSNRLATHSGVLCIAQCVSATAWVFFGTSSFLLQSKDISDLSQINQILKFVLC